MKKPNPHSKRAPVNISAYKGPYQDNGASPWYSPVLVGTGTQSQFKMNFDTGARFIWLTSVECTTVACTMPDRQRFDPAASPTFVWIDQNTVQIDFGPWGTMEAKVGQDIFNASGRPVDSVRDDFYVTTWYDGQQFMELNWDGGIGVPSGFAPDPKSSNYVLSLLNAGIISPDEAFISFDMDPSTKMGRILVGFEDPSAFIPESKVVIEFTPYLPGLEYIWTTPLHYWHVGGVPVAENKMYCHDTGSSQFKGDPPIMIRAADEVNAQFAATGQYPDLDLSLGTRASDGQPARFRLTSDQYVTLIEKGSGEGEYTININPLAGLDDLVLVGSIMLDYVYLVYRFVVTGTPGNYSLAPGQVEMYNKVGGPVIIQP